MNTRIATIISASLTLLAVSAAATAKSYVTDVSEFTFVILVTVVGLVIARFWSQTLAKRLLGPVTPAVWREQAVTASAAFTPAIILLVGAWIGWLVSGSVETAATAAMATLSVALFAYTWVGTHAFLWSVGTAAVSAAMILFKVVV